MWQWVATGGFLQHMNGCLKCRGAVLPIIRYHLQ